MIKYLLAKGLALAVFLTILSGMLTAQLLLVLLGLGGGVAWLYAYSQDAF